MIFRRCPERDYAKRCLRKAEVDLTNGTEFLECIKDSNEKRNMELELFCSFVKVGHPKCDYCEAPLIAVWDEYATNGWCYFGRQAIKPYAYKYSKIINLIRRFYGVAPGDSFIENNNLMNSHTRVHIEPSSFDEWIKSEAAVKVLCNNCFSKTVKRTLVKDGDRMYSISVVEDRGETIESVMDELGLQGEIIGPGSIKEY